MLVLPLPGRLACRPLIRILRCVLVLLRWGPSIQGAGGGMKVMDGMKTRGRKMKRGMGLKGEGKGEKVDDDKRKKGERGGKQG